MADTRVTVIHARAALDIDSGDLIDDAYVCVEGDRITAVGSDSSTTADADEVIELPDLTLLPGLMDMEVDLVLGGPGAGLTDPVVTDPVKMTLRATVNARRTLQAGFTTGRTVTKNCAVVDNPMSLRFCEVKQPVMGNYRVSGAYMFPWQVQVSGVFQSLPPDPVAVIANYPVTNATPGMSLGRPIATPGGTIPVSLVEPSSYPDYGDRVNQVDLRVTKGWQVGQYRVEVMADYYSSFNVAPVQTYTTAYGPAWLTPQTYLQAAFLKLGGRFSF